MQIAGLIANTNVCDRTGGRTLLQRMLLIGNKVILQAEMFLHCIAYRIQTSVSGCNDHTRLTIIGRCNLCDNSIVLFEVYFLDLVRLGDILKFIFEDLEDLIRLKLFMLNV